MGYGGELLLRSDDAAVKKGRATERPDTDGGPVIPPGRALQLSCSITLLPVWSAAPARPPVSFHGCSNVLLRISSSLDAGRPRCLPSY